MGLGFEQACYLAVIGDIKGSRKLHNRFEVQECLKSTLQDVNTRFADDIAANFTITLGDEFQGLLNSGKNIMELFFTIERKMYPVEFRLALGLGTITTKINPQLAIGADGPAFHRARAAIDQLKKNEQKKQTALSDTRIALDSKNQQIEDLLNTIFILLTAIKASWSKRQRETIWNIQEHGDSQTKVATRLGISQVSVQRNLANGHYYSYKEAVNSVNQVLGNIW